MIPFKTIVADPPWAFIDSLPGPKRGAKKHYNMMTIKEIQDYLPTAETLLIHQDNPKLQEFHKGIPPLAIDDNARLFLWRVASMQEEATQVMRHWGFTLKTEAVWAKMTVNRRRAFGMGRTVRGEHEIAIIGNRGRPEILDKSTRSILWADEGVWDESPFLFDGIIGKHSQKPDDFYALVESISPGPYLELFARTKRAGWACIGDELNGLE